jgi:hypothetical protein
LKKKKQKTFDISASVLQETPKPNSQSFLVLFFKKEVLSRLSVHKQQKLCRGWAEPIRELPCRAE